MTRLLVLVAPLLVLLLTGCVSINTVVRDPKSGQTEACNVKFYVVTMKMEGRCTDGSTMESRVVNGQAQTTARDRFGAVVTCGPTFNGAPCWPAANAPSTRRYVEGEE